MGKVVVTLLKGSPLVGRVTASGGHLNFTLMGALMDKIFLTSKQLSEKIDTPVYTIRKLVREGVLPAYRITGKNYLFDFDEVVKIIKAKTGLRMRQKFPFLDKVYWAKTGIWSRGYFISTVGISESIVKKYIEMQGKEDSGQALLEF